jgi:hypothetical protein
VELCGNAARRGTVDCDRLGATATRVDEDGTGLARLLVGQPPAPCPCVVRVSVTGVGATTSVPIELAGLAVENASDTSDLGSMEAVRTIEVLATSIAPDERNMAVFGFGVGRRIDVTLRNAGTVVLSDVTVSGVLSGWAAGSQPVAGPPPFTLAAGAERQISIPVELPSPAFGDYRFVGRIDGGDRAVEISVGTSHVPWGLVNAVVVGVASVLVIAARRARRSSAARPPRTKPTLRLTPRLRSGGAAVTPRQAPPGDATPVS